MHIHLQEDFAVNILAISFTGVQIGMDLALARIILSIVFGVGIGLLMAFFFHKGDEAPDSETKCSRAHLLRKPRSRRAPGSFSCCCWAHPLAPGSR